MQVTSIAQADTDDDGRRRVASNVLKNAEEHSPFAVPKNVQLIKRRAVGM
jgi:hypothetical protein